MTEKPTGSEIINPQSIKDRVMEIFQGVDLQKEGSYRVGLLNIETNFIKHLGEWQHTATMSGLRVARYNHLDPSVEQPPLGEGQFREIESYHLEGYRAGRGFASASFTHNEGREDGIYITVPGNAFGQGKGGKIEDLNPDDQKDVAGILEIKI
jgi:hypothetical protein